ncbi:DNA replication complex GINS protein psf3-like protein [Parathielavia appendiculata]|uniref:DNA replication complex GINS protein PSF3 n=1 Tax=Parathielavia appendiculata TaxID=2587402 RepID=A0AAN6TVB2_9PEZI|nr:DNA replication complex GINS protein psf3-like protein [Parathielavia appendiculata]
MSYYDIDSILTDAEKIPCTFQLDIPDLGYLDNTPTQPLKAGTKVNLPLWLAEMLAIANASDTEGKPFVTFDLPPALGNDVVQALKADPRAVPLRDQSAHFYGLATQMMELSEEQELAAILRKTFVIRASEVALYARKVGGVGHKGKGGADEGSNLGVGGAGEDFLRALDEWERSLFRKAHDGTKSGKEWMEGIKKH